MPLKKSQMEIELIKEVQKLWEKHWENPSYKSWNDYQMKLDELLVCQRSRLWDEIKGMVYA